MPPWYWTGYIKLLIITSCGSGIYQGFTNTLAHCSISGRLALPVDSTQLSLRVLNFKGGVRWLEHQWQPSLPSLSASLSPSFSLLHSGVKGLLIGIIAWNRLPNVCHNPCHCTWYGRRDRSRSKSWSFCFFYVGFLEYFNLSFLLYYNNWLPIRLYGDHGLATVQVWIPNNNL